MALEEENVGLDQTFQLVKIQALSVWRHRWVMIAIAIVVSLIGWPLVMKLPNQYEASTRLYVNTQTMLKPVLKGLAVQSELAVEIAELTKRTLMTRGNIQRIIRESDLDISVNNSKQEERLIASLSDRINITSQGKDKKSRGPDTFYTIQFTHNNPQTAYSVVKSVLDIFIESSMGETRKDTTLTEKFLQEQIDEYESRLLRAEQNLKVFKQQNINFMSGQTGGYFKQFSDAKDQLREAKLQLREAREKSKRLQQEIDKVASGVTQSSDGTAFDDRIAKLNQQLDDLSLQYTDQHPNIIALKQTIAELENQKAESLQDADNQASSGDLANNKLYQELTIELGRSNADVSALKVRVEEYSEEVERLRNLIDTIPDVEAKLAQLNRDYEVNKEKYNSLLSRRESASISKQAETSTDQVMFKIIEAPKVPVIPEGPNRPLLLAAIYIVSLGIGIAIAWLLSQIKPTILDSRTITEKFGHEVIGVVSVVMSPQQRAYERRKLMGFIFIIVVHMGLAITLVASQFLYDDPLALAKQLAGGLI